MPRYLATLVVVAFFIPTGAMAHSNAVRMAPKDGARLKTLPAEATITFDEPPKTANMALRSPDGTVHRLRTRVEGASIVAKLPPHGPRGTYGLSYRVVSADGHPVLGTTAFAVSSGPTPAPPPLQQSRTGESRVQADRGLPMIAVLGIAAIALGAVAVAAARARR
ncbi:MAG TPA: copper resistance CopC family protein [Aeromicrobium sp.]|nr:copper resistance CopC family protein [Aeromicrobium sp.]